MARAMTRCAGAPSCRSRVGGHVLWRHGGADIVGSTKNRRLPGPAREKQRSSSSARPRHQRGATAYAARRAVRSPALAQDAIYDAIRSAACKLHRASPPRSRRCRRSPGRLYGMLAYHFSRAEELAKARLSLQGRRGGGGTRLERGATSSAASRLYFRMHGNRGDARKGVAGEERRPGAAQYRRADRIDRAFRQRLHLGRPRRAA